MASFTSQFGDWMTRTAETVFVMPDALKMTNNGIIYGARLLEKAQTFQVTDPVFRANLDEHFKQCVFYDVLLGFKPMEDLTTSNNLWAAIGPGSQARAQKFLTRSGTSVTSAIIRCDTAYQQLTAQWVAVIDADLPLFPREPIPTSRTRLLRSVSGTTLGSWLVPCTAVQPIPTLTFSRFLRWTPSWRRARASRTRAGRLRRAAR
ncbi:MAG: conjugal transfer protein TraG [Nitrospiraceae bacterium]|nr:conjugal transfer protein TraG [Nitrospiraceae bacterium]